MFKEPAQRQFALTARRICPPRKRRPCTSSVLPGLGICQLCNSCISPVLSGLGTRQLCSPCSMPACCYLVLELAGGTFLTCTTAVFKFPSAAHLRKTPSAQRDANKEGNEGWRPIPLCHRSVADTAARGLYRIHLSHRPMRSFLLSYTCTTVYVVHDIDRPTESYGTQYHSPR